MGNFTVIRKVGGSRIVAVSKYVPKTWEAVTIEVKKASGKSVVLEITKIEV